MSLRVRVAVLVLVGLVVGCDESTSPIVSSGPPKTTPAMVHGEAQKCADAFMASDWEAFSHYTHPTIMKEMGGRDKMISTVKKGMTDMKAQGFTFNSYNVSAPSEVLASGSELYAVVPSKLVLGTPKGKMTSAGYLLGLSTDNGRTWHFVDGAGLNGEMQKKILPNPPPGLKLPAPSQPTLTP